MLMVFGVGLVCFGHGSGARILQCDTSFQNEEK